MRLPIGLVDDDEEEEEEEDDNEEDGVADGGSHVCKENKADNSGKPSNSACTNITHASY